MKKVIGKILFILGIILFAIGFISTLLTAIVFPELGGGWGGYFDEIAILLFFAFIITLGKKMSTPKLRSWK